VQKIASLGTLFIAAEKGYFAAEGVPGQFVYFEAATPMAVAAVAGDVDFGVTGLTVGFYSFAGQGQHKLIAGYVREVANFQSNAVFASNRAYAAGLTGDARPWQLGGAYTTTKLANERPDIVNGFLRAYRRGSRDYYDAFIGPDGRRRDGPTAPEALAIIAKYTGQPAATLSKGIGYVDPDERIDEQDVLHQIDWYKSQKLLKPELDGGAIIDRRYAVPLPPG
jgi:ABC-type nitrate/sulfonate/bicarbonate transport system substrate-binding protein